MFHSASFDFSVWEIWGALLHGGRLVIVPPEAKRSPARLIEVLREQRVTVLNQTPSAFRQIAAAPVDELMLRLIVFGGERLDVGMLADWFDRHGDEEPQLVNMYGITETTVHVTYRRIVRADLTRPRLSPIGVPIPDLRVSLRDETGAVVDAGVPGELWVSGPGVTRGYLQRPELTAARFVTGPDGQRAYRSGDLAARDAAGDLVYVGRIDDQIKVRGYRIEPTEVELTLAEHPDVAAAVVTIRDFGDGDVRLLAHVRPRSCVPAPDLADRLRRFAADRLPQHMRPSEYELIEEIPMTAQGKVDRAALRGEPATVDPPDPVVESVAAIAEEILRRPAVPSDDDLFDIGATSLAFIRIITKVNEQFQTALNGSEVGDVASVRMIGRAVRSALGR
jgi:acyl-coenzyme A synthetase/AMP-(fatty) acid ligase/acyl carrier protein